MQTTSVKSTIDPVCEMSVDPQTTQITVSVEGQDYYFCAGCP